MDIISHGLYGGVAFGRKSKVSYWKAFLIGISPDLFSFGIFSVLAMLNVISGPGFGKMDPSEIPPFVHELYNVTHSLIIATLAISFVWFVLKKQIVELFAWPLHILVDIPTHSSQFFPTPFLWPFSDYYVDGVNWGTPVIFFSNLAFLAVLYIWFYISRRRKAHG
jgi:hypothetical protein